MGTSGATAAPFGRARSRGRDRRGEGPRGRRRRGGPRRRRGGRIVPEPASRAASRRARSAETRGGPSAGTKRKAPSQATPDRRVGAADHWSQARRVARTARRARGRRHPELVPEDRDALHPRVGCLDEAGSRSSAGDEPEPFLSTRGDLSARRQGDGPDRGVVELLELSRAERCTVEPLAGAHEKLAPLRLGEGPHLELAELRACQLGAGGAEPSPAAPLEREDRRASPGGHGRDAQRREAVANVQEPPVRFEPRARGQVEDAGDVGDAEDAAVPGNGDVGIRRGPLERHEGEGADSLGADAPRGRLARDGPADAEEEQAGPHSGGEENAGPEEERATRDRRTCCAESNGMPLNRKRARPACDGGHVARLQRDCVIARARSRFARPCS